MRELKNEVSTLSREVHDDGGNLVLVKRFE